MMTALFRSCLAHDLEDFLQFKRRMGYRYRRAEFTLREFDRFLTKTTRRTGTGRLDRAAITWLASKPGRKAVSVSMDAAVLRQLFRYLRRLPVHADLKEPYWPHLPTTSTFVPHVLSVNDIKQLLAATARLGRPRFRAVLYRCLILMLYCTGIRFGEALRLRMRDVDHRTGVLFIDEFKGRARWVPLHRSLARELQKYLRPRRAFAPAGPDDRLFVGCNRSRLPVSTAWHTFDTLFRRTGLKSERGRTGPRPYDLRQHAGSRIMPGPAWEGAFRACHDQFGACQVGIIRLSSHSAAREPGMEETCWISSSKVATRFDACDPESLARILTRSRSMSLAADTPQRRRARS